MKRRWKIVASAATVLAALGSLFVALDGDRVFRVATSSISRSLCSAVFVSQVDPEIVLREEQLPESGMALITWALRYDVDRSRREVRTSLIGAFGSRAVFRDGLGCLLVAGEAEVPEASGLSGSVAARVEPVIAYTQDERIQKAIAQSFVDPDAARRRNTKAVVVLHKGRLIAEQYAPGYGPDTPIWGHSLSKSVTSALIGILVRERHLAVDRPAPVSAWQSPGDPRQKITPDQLLRMTSGLPFDERGGPVNPMTRMLFLEPDTAAYAQTVELEAEPGTRWGYSNLGFQILSRLIRDAAGGTAVTAERFVREQLFDPLAMHSAVIETDFAGTPIGASHVYASARDWARFGQLYLDDGVAGGRRILPEGWVAYTRSPTLDTGYGAGFWLNTKNDGVVPYWDAPWGMPQLPKDMYYARGYLGQYIVIVPSHRLVVVRMGMTHIGIGTGIGGLVADIIGALPTE